MKPTIIVNKSGGPLYGYGAENKISPVSSMCEIMGLLEYLATRDDIDVVYFGQVYGDVPEDIAVVEPLLDDLNDMSTGEKQRKHWEWDVLLMENTLKTLKYGPPIALLQVAGYSPTWATIDNAKGAQPQSVGVRHIGPALNMCQSLGLPRLIINNDPRTYPKDQEMSFGWDWTRPRALLDQWDDERSMVVGGYKYRRNSVYAACESYHNFDLNGKNTDEQPCVIMSHAHISDGIKGGHGDAWDMVLEGNDYPVIGRGWPKGGRYQDVTRDNNINAIASTVMCSPVVAHTPGFLTGKPHRLIQYGCIPILFGDGEHPHTYDREGVYCNLATECRIRKPGDLKKIVDKLEHDAPYREYLRTHWRKVCEPQWYKLNEMIENLVGAFHVGGVDEVRNFTSTDLWFSYFGGYGK